MNMWKFSENNDRVENIGELVLEALLSSNIDSITELVFYDNKSWFRHPETEEEMTGKMCINRKNIYLESQK